MIQNRNLSSNQASSMKPSTQTNNLPFHFRYAGATFRGESFTDIVLDGVALLGAMDDAVLKITGDQALFNFPTPPHNKQTFFWREIRITVEWSRFGGPSWT